MIPPPQHLKQLQRGIIQTDVCVLLYSYKSCRTKPSEGRAALVSHSPPSTEQEYLFVVQPSKDFFCPVTCGLLLQPHLTECCGNHFSQEAVARIQREGKSCPMCNSAPFNTMLNKQFLRQVNELRVFCHHEDRGCEWQGELSALEGHISSCRVGDTLPMTDLSEHPEYVCS